MEHCPACGEPEDYCQGHGDIGDPRGRGILSNHDDDDHSECHPDSECHGEERFLEVVFMQGEEADEILDSLERREGAVLQGATAETIADAVETLAQWDGPDNDGRLSSAVPCGWGDRVASHTVGGDVYWMVWSAIRAPHVGLVREVPAGVMLP